MVLVPCVSSSPWLVIAGSFSSIWDFSLPGLLFAGKNQVFQASSQSLARGLDLGSLQEPSGQEDGQLDVMGISLLVYRSVHGTPRRAVPKLRWHYTEVRDAGLG